MATISVYLQQAAEAADHVLYGVVNAVSGSPPKQIISVTSGGSYGGSLAVGPPFNGAEGKKVRRYTSANWNTRGSEQRPYALDADEGYIVDPIPVTNPTGMSFQASGITNQWAVNDVWAIDFHSPYSFGKWAESDKTTINKTADQEKATNDSTSDEIAGTSSTALPANNMRPLMFGVAPTAGAALAYQQGVFGKNGEQDIDPLTTKWELKCDTLGRNYANSAVPLPMPSMGKGDQYFNMLLDIGMRQETINMSGTLVDRGAPSATNPRLQTLFDIIRTQHSPTMDLGGEDQGGEGNPASPSNPMSYLRLTIGSGYEPSDYQESTGVAAGATPPQTPTLKMNENLIVRDRNYRPGGPHNAANLGVERTVKAYRGLVTQFSANIVGGKPDIWTWQMTFNVVKNEHDWTFST